jgi:cytochrome oxidase Cu insertion factor (SCO1/SenC/PrrC family)
MKSLNTVVTVLGIGLAVAVASSAGFAETQAVKASEAENVAADEKARQYFTDLEVVDQNGRRMRFYSDVLRDRVVLINFMHTSCRTGCSLITQKLIQVRRMLVDAVKDDIWFLSISVDPERDTPQDLKKYARQQGVDESRWLFLTGSKRNMTHIVQKLGQYEEDIGAHSTLMLAGNTRTRHWTKVMPVTPPPGVAAKLRELAEERPR